MEFYASYVYVSMYTYFDKDDTAYPGFAAFFKKSSDEEREHGEKLISIRTREEARLSSKTLPNLPPWSGELLWMPLRQLLNLRKLSIKACWTCTKPQMETLTCVTTSSPNSLTRKLRESRRSPLGSP